MYAIILRGVSAYMFAVVLQLINLRIITTTPNHGFFLSAVLLKCMVRLAYSSNNVEVLLPL